MLTVFDEIQFVKVLEKGGRNKPWLVSANAGDRFENYVLKVFDEDPDQFFTASEVYGSLLASEFDLPTPEIALFDLTIETLMCFPPELQEVLRDKGPGVKFGSKYMQGSLTFDPTIGKHRQMVNNRVAMDTLFAFDQLIKNVDRNTNKPNVLLLEDDFMVIDHELAFKDMDGTAQTSIIEGNAVNKNHRYHILFDILKGARERTKSDYFDTFHEYLRTLNVNTLSESHDQLVDLGVPTGNFVSIKAYLEFAKANSQQFVNGLKKVLR